MGKLRRSAYVRDYLKRDEPTWVLKKYFKTYKHRMKKFHILRKSAYLHLPPGEFNRMVKHPRIWWANQYWILNGGTQRRVELQQKLATERRRPRIAAKLTRLRRFKYHS